VCAEGEKLCTLGHWAGQHSTTTIIVSQFTLNANRIGKFKLTLSACMLDDQVANAREGVVVREIEVIPNGREQDMVFNGRLDSTATHDLNFPAASIPPAPVAVFPPGAPRLHRASLTWSDSI
jgi:hypothetical protein